MVVRIFQIGFNKCGTRTLSHFFEANGLASVHWDGGRLARAMFDNLDARRPIITGYDDNIVFTDMEWLDGKVHLEGYKLYRELAAEHPDALFILNTRNREDWIGSRLRHRKGAYAKEFQHLLDAPDVDAVCQFWRGEWDAHHRAVREFFADGRHRFLVFDANDSAATLVAALPEYKLDTARYKVKGRSTRKEPTGT